MFSKVNAIPSYFMSLLQFSPEHGRLYTAKETTPLQVKAMNEKITFTYNLSKYGENNNPRNLPWSNLI